MPTKRDAPHPILYGEYLGMIADRQAVIAAGVESMAETGYTEGAELIMVAYGTPGRIVTVLGGNGTGKSTLLKAASGLIRVYPQERHAAERQLHCCCWLRRERFMVSNSTQR